MSKIQEAMRRLQERRSPAQPNEAVSAERAIPPARSKRIEFRGPKTQIDLDRLIAQGLLAPVDQAAPVADQFRRIKRPLIQNAVSDDQQEQNANLVMVTSASSGEGKTFCSLNLAASISLERDLSVLLVDADLNNPSITRAFGLEGVPGLTDVLDGEANDVANVLVRTDLNDIAFLPAGQKHSQSTELLASDRMGAVMQELSTRYRDRLVIVDSPPVLLTSQAQALSKQVGQIAFVVESGVTSQSDISDSLDMLATGKATNFILNKSSYTTLGDYYGSVYGADVADGN